MKGLSQYILRSSWLLKSFLAYYGSASTIYELHSPFLYRYLKFVTDPDRKYYGMSRLRPLRDIISRRSLNKNRDDLLETISTLEKQHPAIINWQKEQSRRKLIHCLFRSVVFLGSKKILHLGAGNGLDSLFLKMAAGKNAKLFIAAQNKSLTHQLQKNFSYFNAAYENIELPDESNPEIKHENFDLVVFGCSLDPEKYSVSVLDQIAELCGEDASWIMTGIHRSPSRSGLWERIRQSNFTRAELNCWSFGAAFSSSDFHDKTSFTFIPWSWKPWRIGLSSKAQTSGQI